MSKIAENLKAEGISLGPVAKPAANYVPYRVHNNTLYISGQIPVEAGGVLPFIGKLGAEMSVEQGQAAARLCAINILAAAQDALGDLSRVTKVLKLGGFVNSTPDFTSQPEVINGASDLMYAVFGAEIGSHARAAVSTPSLPRGVAVEVDAVIAFD